jgi:hypothetical protein
MSGDMTTKQTNTAFPKGESSKGKSQQGSERVQSGRPRLTEDERNIRGFTKPCRNVRLPGRRCNNPRCTYYHDDDEAKLSPCQKSENLDDCPRGDACAFAHVDETLHGYLTRIGNTEDAYNCTLLPPDEEAKLQAKFKAPQKRVERPRTFIRPAKAVPMPSFPSSPPPAQPSTLKVLEIISSEVGSAKVGSAKESSAKEGEEGEVGSAEGSEVGSAEGSEVGSAEGSEVGSAEVGEGS